MIYRNLFFTLLLILGFAGLPVLAAKDAPETGKEMHEEIVANMPLLKGKLADYVNQVGQRIVRHLDRPR